MDCIVRHWFERGKKRLGEKIPSHSIVLGFARNLNSGDPKIMGVSMKEIREKELVSRPEIQENRTAWECVRKLQNRLMFLRGQLSLYCRGEGLVPRNLLGVLF